VVRQRTVAAAYTALVTVQPIPPYGIEAPVATYPEERRPTFGSLETPLYANIESVDPVEWNNVVGTVTIDSDGGQGPVKRAAFTAAGRSIDLASYNALTPPGGESYC